MKAAGTFIRSFVLVILLGQQAMPAVGPEWNYYFIEAENHQSSNKTDFRDEGFTIWMGHPSGGRTVIFDEGNLSAHLTYDLSELKDGDYVLLVRHLAVAKPQASVEALVNDVSLGVTDFAKTETALTWSKRLGPFKKAGPTVLTLKLAEGNRQAPYVDVLLLTNDLNFTPDNEDQDFMSFSRQDLGVAITSADFAGNADEGHLTVGVQARGNIAAPCTLSAVCKEKAKFLPTRFEKTVALKQGANKIVLPCPGLLQDDYSLGIRLRTSSNVLLAEENQLFAIRAEDFTFTMTPDQYFYANNDSRGGLKIKINNPAVARDAEYFAFRILGVKWKSRRTRVPVESAAARFEFDLAPLPPGPYRVEAQALDGEDRILTSGGGRFQKANVASVTETLEDIQQVSVRDNRLFVNGKPFVVRKLYHAGGAAAVKAQGFNAVDCWGGETLEGVARMLDEAHTNNLYGCAVLGHGYFYKGVDKGWDRVALTAGINKLKNHPALLTWELFDEPDATGIPIKFLLEAVKLIKELDSNHPVLVNLVCYPKFKEYGGAGDIVTMDNYPVPSQPVTEVSLFLDRLAAAVDSKKPIGAALQTWSLPNQRMPTPEELRCMTYLAINHRAQVFAYYSYQESPGYTHCLQFQPALWSYMRCLNAELCALQDLITATESPIKVTSSHPAVDVVARSFNGQLHVIAVNTTNQTVEVTLAMDARGKAERSAALFTEKTYRLKRNEKSLNLTDILAPFDARVFKIPMEKLEH
ncbi:MAG: beta-galactosidase [Verrucomicrobia bacterium]|nr:beta-galactosidase [Verrucomicrobiota bacterium]